MKQDAKTKYVLYFHPFKFRSDLYVASLCNINACHTLSSRQIMRLSTDVSARRSYLDISQNSLKQCTKTCIAARKETFLSDLGSLNRTSYHRLKHKV